GVRPCATVPVDDLLARLELGRPHGVPPYALVVPPGQGPGVWPLEDLAEVPGLRVCQVLDQPEKVGSRQGQGAADVVLRQPIELPQHHLASVAQIAVQVLLRGIIDHGEPACHTPSDGVHLNQPWPSISTAATDSGWPRGRAGPGVRWAQPPVDHACVKTTESKAAAAARIDAAQMIRARAELLGRLRSCFARTQTWQHAGRYLSALVGQ